MQIRLAQPADNARILDFQTRHAMQGSLPLRFDRAPDYFALHRCHASAHEVWLAEDEQAALKGIASLVVRDGYLGERVQPVAYLGDLRLMPDRRLSRGWTDAVRERFAALRREAGVHHAYCCMIRDNRLAMQSLARSRREHRLRFAHWHGYENVSIYAQRGLSSAVRLPPGVRIVNAQPHHADALRALLDAESRRQPFGCVFSDAEFARRLDTWPAFGIDSFLLALDARDNLLGCVAPWDAGDIKRIVLERLPLPLNAIRVAFNALAPALRRPRIAGPGEPLRDVYLTHLQVRGRDPAVFAALLDAAWARVRDRHALLQLCLYDADPLWPALARYRAARTPMDLYTLSTGEPTEPIDGLLAGRVPGFEIYLV
ncbi:hypothetical protein HT746_19285 [Burkholderia pyrrocinia]|uniref:hypothetical protein n=1 Tax=Burkholderia pyrrocinia TaxID=60550 RepID=UPI001576DA43|nr:hypothetical protein [Burkholderia pyrrocinia]NTX29245.1 hypothetical protein [Burkholderia pyrrocinia]QVN21082.1 hypothetical protein JYG32_31615 [Burkholderia pyrrocinia]